MCHTNATPGKHRRDGRYGSDTPASKETIAQQDAQNRELSEAVKREMILGSAPQCAAQQKCSDCLRCS
jgi:hypothetical protein